MKLVLKQNEVIATHDDNQNITLTMYPCADKICYVPDNTSIPLEQTDPRICFDVGTLREYVRIDINNVTDSLFLISVFTYGDIEFPVKKDNQFDYKTVVDEARAGFIEYPYEIKGSGSTYYEIQDVDGANAFFIAGMTVVQTILRTGWALKDSLADMTVQELVEFEDPRI